MSEVPSLFGFVLENKAFLDTTLCLTQNGEIHRETKVSKTILSAFSLYFFKLFTSGMKEATSERIEIDISHDDGFLFHCLIKSFYTGVLSVDQYSGTDTDHNDFKEIEILVSLLRVADRFLIEKKYPDCVSLLEKVPLTIRNACYQYVELEGYQHIEGVKALRQSMEVFVLDKFKDFDKMWQTNEFLSLPSSLLGHILGSDELLVTTEATVLQALRKWFNRIPNDRAGDLESLLKFVRFIQIDPVYLSEYVLSSERFFEITLLANSLQVKAIIKKYVEGAIRYHSLTPKLKSFQGVIKGCVAGGLPENWGKKRNGYQSKETSKIIEFDVTSDKPAVSEAFYFRGVYFYFSFVNAVDNKKGYFLYIDLKKTIGKEDELFRSFYYNFTLQVLNQTTFNYDNIFSNTLQGFSSNGLGYLLENKSPFDLVTKTAKLRACLSVID